ncbi:MAG: hypothetical protein JNM17_37010 [Archangium sp.]|nr:hypothetical protein [Archangium sp.]
MTAIGCESVEDVVAKQKPAVEKSFAALTPLAAKVKDLTPLESNTFKANTPIVLDGPNANAMFIYAEDLASPKDAPKDVPLRTIDSLPLLQCASLLSSQHLFNDKVTRVAPSVASSYLGACSNVKYALVIATREYLRPMLQLETKQFAPGKYRADVLVFDIANAQLLGGFMVAATNDSRVSLLDGDQNHVQRLIGNLESTTFDALRAEAKKNIPGVMP